VLSPNRQPVPQNLAPTTPEQASVGEQQEGTATHSAFNKVSSVIEERCTVCHSAKPTSPLFSTAPAGVMFDTPEQIQQMAAKIHAQTVASQIMPLGNITQMTQEERDLLASWIEQGAQIN